MCNRQKFGFNGRKRGMQLNFNLSLTSLFSYSTRRRRRRLRNSPPGQVLLVINFSLARQGNWYSAYLYCRCCPGDTLPGNSLPFVSGGGWCWCRPSIFTTPIPSIFKDMLIPHAIAGQSYVSPEYRPPGHSFLTDTWFAENGRQRRLEFVLGTMEGVMQCPTFFPCKYRKIASRELQRGRLTKVRPLCSYQG